MEHNNASFPSAVAAADAILVLWSLEPQGRLPTPSSLHSCALARGFRLRGVKGREGGRGCPGDFSRNKRAKLVGEGQKRAPENFVSVIPTSWVETETAGQWLNEQ